MKRLLLALCLLLCPLQSSATTWNVTDTNSLNNANLNVQPGDVVNMADGTYGVNPGPATNGGTSCGGLHLPSPTHGTKFVGGGISYIGNTSHPENVICPGGSWAGQGYVYIKGVTFTNSISFVAFNNYDNTCNNPAMVADTAMAFDGCNITGGLISFAAAYKCKINNLTTPGGNTISNILWEVGSLPNNPPAAACVLDTLTNSHLTLYNNDPSGGSTGMFATGYLHSCPSILCPDQANNWTDQLDVENNIISMTSGPSYGTVVNNPQVLWESMTNSKWLNNWVVLYNQSTAGGSQAIWWPRDNFNNNTITGLHLLALGNKLDIRLSNSGSTLPYEGDNTYTKSDFWNLTSGQIKAQFGLLRESFTYSTFLSHSVVTTGEIKGSGTTTWDHDTFFTDGIQVFSIGGFSSQSDGPYVDATATALVTNSIFYSNNYTPGGYAVSYAYPTVDGGTLGAGGTITTNGNMYFYSTSASKSIRATGNVYYSPTSWNTLTGNEATGFWHWPGFEINQLVHRPGYAIWNYPANVASSSIINNFLGDNEERILTLKASYQPYITPGDPACTTGCNSGNVPSCTGLIGARCAWYLGQPVP